ncbi:uncharacterized protein LOC132378374 [Hypanus sabinus]|uniref:uncharacterized protein LOC132378374 n=1 Tax=Hypanus sabinus TaxID=79690 RepID=UPI0028C4BAC1|nr:uncharacterized protein LOC132378374 [Hypanus sabinus]
MEETGEEEVSSQIEKACRQCKREDRQVIEKGRAQTKGLRCVYFNARSVVNKADELRTWISTYRYDVVVTTNTWMAQGQEWLLQVPGFRCFRKGREGGKRNGGLALLIRHSVTAAMKVDIMEGLYTESLWVEVRNRKGSITLLGVFCRPPNSNRDIEEQIGKQILEICNNNRVVMMEDFNFPNSDWHLPGAKGLDGVEFVRCVQEGFLTQYVDKPTRGEAVLDLVLGSEPGQVSGLSVGDYFGDSDHNSISFTIALERDWNKQLRKMFNWSKGHYEAIRQEIGGLNWKQMSSGKSMEERWQIFRE